MSETKIGVFWVTKLKNWKLKKEMWPCSIILKFGRDLEAFGQKFLLFITVLVNLISPPPRKILETLRTGHFFIVSPPYTMTKIHKKQNFVILSGMYLPWYTHFVFAWIYTLSILPWYTLSWWKLHRKMILRVSFQST